MIYMAVYRIEVSSSFEVEAENEFTALIKVMKIVEQKGMDINVVRIERKG